MNQIHAYFNLQVPVEQVDLISDINELLLRHATRQTDAARDVSAQLAPHTDPKMAAVLAAQTLQKPDTPVAALVKPSEPEISKADVLAACVGLANAKGRKAAEAILATHGADHLDRLDTTKYADCHKALKAALA